MDHIYRVRVEHLPKNKINDIIKKFLDVGWEQIDNFNLENIHIFIGFKWSSGKGNPIYPEGFRQDKH